MVITPLVLRFQNINMPLRLGFHYHLPFQRSPDGTLQTAGFQGRFLDTLAAHCDTLVCFAHSPRPNEQNLVDYTLQAPNIQWIDMGLRTSVPHRMLNARAFTQALKDNRHCIDALLIRGPSPLLPAMAKAAGDLPLALLLVGDYVAGVEDMNQPRWRKEAVRLWTQWNQAQERTVARRALTFVNSSKLFSQLQGEIPNLVETRTTTLYASDFYVREDTCQQKPYHLLYTGRIDRAKGLLLLVEAVAQLVERGHDLVFDLVGWPEKGDTILDEIMALAVERGIGERVIAHGFKSVGPELFSYYQQSDIYVMASQSSEGFPRTLWEALAHSLPILSTNVGAIATYLQDGETASLVPTGGVEPLVKQLEVLFQDAELRQRLIAQGRELARTNTLEYRAKEMISHLESWVKNHR